MAKRKTTGELSAKDRRILDVAKRLTLFDIDAELLLGLALVGDEIARSVEPFDPAEAIRKDVFAIYAPSVLVAIVEAATVCRVSPGKMPSEQPPIEVRGRVVEVGKASGLHAPEAHARILRISQALRSPAAWTRAFPALQLARWVQAEAEKLATDPTYRPGKYAGADGRPNAAAVAEATRNVVERHSPNATGAVEKLTPKARTEHLKKPVKALKERIRLAAKAAPDLGWPPLTSRPRGKKHS